MMPNRKEYVVSSEPGSCEECPKYKRCTSPCSRVELWINQDSVGRNSKLLLENGSSGGNPQSEYLDLVRMSNGEYSNDPDSDTSQRAWEMIMDMMLSDKVTRFIYSYYMLGKKIRDIAIEEGASSQAIDQRHIQAKKTIRESLERSRSWAIMREKLSYRDIVDYDACELYFNKGYPRRTVAKLVGRHIITVSKIIRNKIECLNSL